MSAQIKIGKVVGTHGLAGFLKVYPYINDIADFELYTKVFIANQEMTIAKVKYKKNTPLIQFKDYQDINKVENFIGEELFVPKAVATSLLAEDEYLLEDLLGLKVYDQEQNLLGKVVDMRQTPSQSTFVIDGQKGEWFLPYVDQFVISVDLEKGIVVQLIEGLIDEN